MKRNVTFGLSGSVDGASHHGSAEYQNGGYPQPGERHAENKLSSMVSKLSSASRRAGLFVNSHTGRGVFKCSIAYLLGSLATFLPFVAAFLGQQDGKHMVATITVYFHPARSRGSMLEAIACAVVAFIYAVAVSFFSMWVSVFFGKTLNLIILGHVVVLIIFCGGGLGFVGWTKQRLGHPLVNISCSLTSLAIITVLTKEGAVQAAEFSDEKVIQVMKMIFLGVVATTAVSLLISPVSAKVDLQSDLIQVTDSFSDLMTMITRGFLNGSEEELRQQQFSDASDKYKKVLKSLEKNLNEAKYEHLAVGTEKEYALEARLVKCIQRLAQNIGGLRSAATIQFLLLAQTGVSFAPTPSSTPRLSESPSTFSSFPYTISGQITSAEQGVLPVVDEVVNEDEPLDDRAIEHSLSDVASLAPTIKSPSDIFGRFIMQLGPSMVQNTPIY